MTQIEFTSDTLKAWGHVPGRAFGAALREAVNSDPERFDRVTILKETHDPVEAAARLVIRAFGAPPQS